MISPDCCCYTKLIPWHQKTIRGTWTVKYPCNQAYSCDEIRYTTFLHSTPLGALQTSAGPNYVAVNHQMS